MGGLCGAAFAQQFTRLGKTYANLSLNDLYAHENRIIAVGTDFSNGYQGVIFISNDAGEHWDTLQVPPSGYFFKTVEFRDEQTGYIGGYGGISVGLKSTDGGNTWKYYWQDFANAGVTDMHFINERVGFACGYGASQFFSGNVYKTTDGGETWNAQKDPMDSLPMDAMQMVNEQYGFAWGGTFGARKILRTTDSGATWQHFYTHSTVPGGMYWWSKDEGILVDTRGGIYKTSDGGQNWVPKPSGTQLLNSVTFIDRHTGYAVGNNGLIIKSTDGGETWQAQQPVTNKMLYKVEYHDGHVYAVGDEGVIVRSEAITGVRETPLGDELQVYPNPATGCLSVSTRAADKGSVQIADLQGRVLLHDQLVNGSARLDVSALARGIYLLEVNTGAERVVKKIMAGQ